MQPRILITRLSAIGDCIETLPVAMALKTHWPDCYIRWIVDCGASNLLDLCPAIDEIIRVPKGFLKDLNYCFQLRRRLRAERVDIAIDPQGLTKSALVAWLSGARRRIGFARPTAREIAPWLYNERIEARREHLVDMQLELLRDVVPSIGPAEFGLQLDQAAELSVDCWLESVPSLKTGFMILNPGAGWPSRVWPIDRYARVARAVYDAKQMRSVISWAGDAERQMAATIQSQSPESTIIAPDTNLHELASLIARARLFVSSDTGPMHLAAAIGIPCVSLFGPTRPQHSGPYGSQHTCIQAWYQTGSSRERRQADNSAMAVINSETVVAACLKQLG